MHCYERRLIYGAIELVCRFFVLFAVHIIPVAVHIIYVTILIIIIYAGIGILTITRTTY